MPPGRPKGTTGTPKTGGRKKGTPNKRTRSIEEKLEALGCDPIAGMAAIANNENNSQELRLSAYKEVAQYVAPKRRAVEHSGPDGGQLVINISGVDALS